MKKMRKYSGATGLKAVPNVPSTFVPRSSPHFVAALSGKGQDQQQRKTSVYKNHTAPLGHPAKKHSTIFRSHLPMIQVTMEEAEDRSRFVQRKVSSSTSHDWTRAERDSFETTRSNTSASNVELRQRKISVKERVLVGETPLGRDVLFRRKISNTTAPKIDKSEEKERLLLKYTTLNNVPLSSNSKSRMKNTYFSRYNVQTNAGKSVNVFSSLSKGSGPREFDVNWKARGRTQSLNFVPKSTDSMQVKGRTTNEVFTPRTFQGDPINSNVFSRGRAQSLNFVSHGSESSAGSVKTRVINDKSKLLYEIVEERGHRESSTCVSENNILQAKPFSKTATLFLQPHREEADNSFEFDHEGKLTPSRGDKTVIKSSRKDSQDRNAFLTFPSLRAKSWTEN